MRLYALSLNLSFAYEFYQYLEEIFLLTPEQSGNKNSRKNIIKTNVESYITNTLQITPPYVGLYFLKLQDKSIYGIPTVPKKEYSFSASNIKRKADYANELKAKTLKVKFKTNHKVNSSKLAGTIDSIIKNPGNYVHLKMDHTDSESETNSVEPIGASVVDDSITVNFEDILQNDHDAPETKPEITGPAMESAAGQSAYHNAAQIATENVPKVTPKPPTVYLNNSTTEPKVKLVTYESETKSGSIEEWYDGNLFLLSLSGESLTDKQKIAKLLGALGGELQRSINTELQRLTKTNHPTEITIADFKNTIIKITKKSATEYSRELDRLVFQGTDVKEFYEKIVNLVRKLLGKDDQNMVESLSSTYLKAKVLKSNYNFQLSEKKGFELVDLAVEIYSISKQPGIAQINNFQQRVLKQNYRQNFGNKQPEKSTESKRQNSSPNQPQKIICGYCKKVGHTYGVCRSRLGKQPQLNNGPGRQNGSNNHQGQNPSNRQNGFQYPVQNRQTQNSTQNMNSSTPSYESYRPQCHHCNKFGHYWKVCRSRERGIPPTQNSIFARRGVSQNQQQ